MIEMIQIIIILLCVYLVFKGVEIFQIAWMSTAPSRRGGMVLGTLMIVASILPGIGVVYLLYSQANAMIHSIDPTAALDSDADLPPVGFEHSTPTGVDRVYVGMAQSQIQSAFGKPEKIVADWGDGRRAWIYEAEGFAVWFDPKTNKVVKASSNW